MKKYVKILLVCGMIIGIFTNCESEAQELTPEQLIKIETSMGDIIVKLYNETPLHRDNMIKLIKEKFYDEQLFHRARPGPEADGGLRHRRAPLAGGDRGTS